MDSEIWGSLYTTLGFHIDQRKSFKERTFNADLQLRNYK